MNHVRTVITLFALLLFGVYLFRIPLVTTIVNLLLHTNGFVVTQIETLNWRNRAIEIKQVTVASLDNSSQHVLQGIQWDLSSWDIQQSRLSINKANLTLTTATSATSATSTTSTAVDKTSLTVKDTLQQLKQFPIAAITIKTLTTAAFEHPLSIHWQSASFGHTLKVADPYTQLQLQIQLHQRRSSDVLIQLQLSPIANNTLPAFLTLDVELDTDNQKVTLSGNINSQQLLSSAQQYWSLPKSLLTIEGVLNLSGDGVVDNTFYPITQQLQFDPQNRLLIVAQLNPQAPPAQLELQFNGPFNISMQDAPEVTLESLSFSLEDAQFGVGATGNIKQAECHWPERNQPKPITPLNCSGEFLLSANIEKVRWQQWQLQNSQLRLASVFSVSERMVEFSVEPESLLRSNLARNGLSTNGNNNGDRISINHMQLSPEGRFVVQLHPPLELSNVSVDKLNVMIPELEQQNTLIATQLSLTDIHVIKQDTTQLSFSLHSNGVNIRTDNTWLPAVAIDSSFKLDGNQLSSDGLLLSDRRQPLLRYTAQHNIEHNSGSVKVNSDTIDINADRPLSQWFSNWPLTWDVQNGQIITQATLNWHDNKLSGNTTQQWLNVTGQYADSALLDINATAKIQLLPDEHIVTTQPISLAVASVDVGIPINDIRSKITIDSKQKRIELLEFNASLLDGRMSAQPVTHTLGQPSSLLLDLNKLNLKTALSMTGYDGVRASGLINGQLPLTISEQGLTVQQGWLSALAPGGVINYTPVSETNNPSIKLVNDALSNYHYDSLEATVAYDRNGDLGLTIALQGENPGFNQGQRIHLNLNVTDNIPMLLRSLRAGRTVADVVKRKLDAQQN